MKKEKGHINATESYWGVTCLLCPPSSDGPDKGYCQSRFLSTDYILADLKAPIRNLKLYFTFKNLYIKSSS